VLADDPQLTVRFDDSESAEPIAFVPPLRVVLDPGLATVGRGRIRDGAAPTLYLHAANAKPPRGFDAAHTAVPIHDGMLDLATVLQVLAARDINEVQVEAGATLAGALLRAGLVDEVLLYVAPVLLGAEARPLFDGLRIDEMAQRLRLQTVETRRFGDDLRLLLRPERNA
jgi:diaminohydroxyphosphoribosylaminopyrimidine deaminase/5-amino-6-(5-phosphoribosylamino)uracil reductase